jgi:hypothetical protein
MLLSPEKQARVDYEMARARAVIRDEVVIMVRGPFGMDLPQLPLSSRLARQLLALPDDEARAKWLNLY